jgi:DNA-binding FadR family transcriptional regulator
MGEATHNVVYNRIFEALVENIRKYLPFGEYFLTHDSDEIRSRTEFNRELVQAIDKQDHGQAYAAAFKKTEQIKRIVSRVLALRA